MMSAAPVSMVIVVCMHIIVVVFTVLALVFLGMILFQVATDWRVRQFCKWLFGKEDK